MPIPHIEDLQTRLKQLWNISNGTLAFAIRAVMFPGPVMHNTDIRCEMAESIDGECLSSITLEVSSKKRGSSSANDIGRRLALRSWASAMLAFHFIYCFRARTGIVEKTLDAGSRVSHGRRRAARMAQITEV